MKTQMYRYLKKNYNHIDIENDNNFLDLSIIDNTLERKEIFLTGENHGVKSNEKLRMKFLKYFKEKTDFKYYLCELPYSMCYFLNLYLKTGDLDILKESYKALEGTDAWNKNDFNHWIKLHEFNESLPKSRRMKIIGIDIEHQAENALKFMNFILPDENIPMEIDNMLKDLIWLKNGIGKASDEYLRSYSYKLDKDLKENKEIYRKYLGENYFGFKFVNKNLLYKDEVYNGNNFNGIRDEKMYKNFLELEKILPQGKIYGQLGLSHVFQRPFPYVKWFGAALNEKASKFKGKVLSFAYVYHNCKYLYPTKRKDYISSIDTLDLEIKVFKEFIDSKTTIFKLNGKNSPFARKLIWPIIHKFPQGGVTTDYFQYLIVIKDSDAMEPMFNF